MELRYPGRILPTSEIDVKIAVSDALEDHREEYPISGADRIVAQVLNGFAGMDVSAAITAFNSYTQQILG